MLLYAYAWLSNDVCDLCQNSKRWLGIGHFRSILAYTWCILQDTMFPIGKPMLFYTANQLLILRGNKPTNCKFLMHMYSCYIHSLIAGYNETYIQTVSLITYNVSININIYYLDHPQHQCSGGATQLKT